MVAGNAYTSKGIMSKFISVALLHHLPHQEHIEDSEEMTVAWEEVEREVVQVEVQFPRRCGSGVSGG